MNITSHLSINNQHANLLKSHHEKSFILKCQMGFNIQSSEIYLDALSNQFCETLIQTLKNLFNHSLIENSTISISENCISVTPNDKLLGGTTNQIKTKIKQTVSWKHFANELFLKQDDSWFELSCHSEDHVPEIREELMRSVMEDFPFNATISFSPSDKQVIFRFYIPNCDTNTDISIIRSLLQGKSATSINDHQLMQIDKNISNVPIDIDAIAKKNLFKLSTADDKLFKRIQQVIKVDELCLFHFLSEKLKTEEITAIKRQIKTKGIMSKIRQMESPLLSSKKMGITESKDIKRNDHFYVHCFIGYPSTTNAEKIAKYVSRTGLAIQEPIRMAYTSIPGTVLLPYDQELNHTFHQFSFLGKTHSIELNKKDNVITYNIEQQNKILFSHHFTEEIFNQVDGLFLLLTKFVTLLNDQDKITIDNDDGTLLKELFNHLFAFRTQVSFPGTLPYAKYTNPKSFKFQFQKLLGQPEMMIPNLKDCESQLKKILKNINVNDPILPPNDVSVIEEIVKYFKQKVNGYENRFAYLGGTSAQLALHFAPEICHLFTPNVLATILKIHQIENGLKAVKDMILIKEFMDDKVTLFSLIERSLQDLDAIQMRMPPNTDFDTSKFNAEVAYLNKLTTYYQYGSVLLRSLYVLSTGNDKATPQMIPFSQKKHLQETIEKGISLLSIPLEFCDKEFSNIHGYTSQAFKNEFERGFKNYINHRQLIYNDVIQTTIADFEQSLVNGRKLLTPSFKHDLLDAKHFIAGLLNDQPFILLDGKITFRELIKNALIRIQSQETISVNGQLIVDAVHNLMKSQNLIRPSNVKKEIVLSKTGYRNANILSHINKNVSDALFEQYFPLNASGMSKKRVSDEGLIWASVDVVWK